MLLDLYLSFCKIGLFAIGGGYAALPLIKQEAVNLHHWLTASTFSNLITISQMTPGPIAINAATFVGMQTCGVTGAIAATLGCITPSIVICSGLAILYQKNKGNKILDSILKVLRPISTGLIAAAGADLLIENSTGLFTMLLFIAAFILLRKTKLGSIKVMLICGVIGVIFNFLY